jgi:hypothetical protein
MRNLRQILASSATAFLVASCSETPLAGGSGSEAGNALKVAAFRSDGTPVVGARIEIRPSGSESTASAFFDTTGSDGSVTLAVGTGSWSIVVRKGDLAYWATSGGSGLVQDTLRPTTSLSGIVEGGAGSRIHAIGMGMDAGCDSSGYFQLEDLPSGDLPLAFSGAKLFARSAVDLLPGIRALALVVSDSIPAQMENLPSDSLIPWSNRKAPATVPRTALGDSGNFSVAVRLQRMDSTSTVWAISWTDSASRGIRIGWRGADTFLLDLDGKTYRVAGIPLTTGIKQIGLSWNGHRISVLMGRDSVVSLTSSSFDRRSAWKTPTFGDAGIAKVEWVAFKRGTLIDDWLGRLSNM